MNEQDSKQIGYIINELQEAAKREQTQSPEWYLDRAARLASLWTLVTADLVKYEMAYKKDVVDAMEKDISVAKAKLLVEAQSENYKEYRLLYLKDKQIAEIIKVAKKRVEVERMI